MKAIGNIYLTWRKGKGHSRIIVGVIKRNKTNGVRFKYINDEGNDNDDLNNSGLNIKKTKQKYSQIGVSKALKEGFTYYTDFPDLTKEYSENVLEILGKRLTNSDRADIQKYYDFWEVNPSFKDDKYYLLAHTQGLLATDNYEFLADYHPLKGLSFISEICGLSYNNIASDFIEIGEELRWELDTKNSFDSNAVRVFKGKTYLGNVKLVHCNVFHKTGGDKLKIRVKSLEKNGHLNRVFIKISF